MPAPANNNSATKSGYRKRDLGAFDGSGMPPGKGVRNEESRVRKFRRAVHTEIVRQRGVVTTFEDSQLQSACRLEAGARLLHRWLRLHPDMPLAEKLSILDRIASHTAARDRILTKLIGTDGSGKSPAHDDPWFALDQAAPLPPEKSPSSFSSPSEPKPAPLVDHAAEAPQTGTEKTERAIYDQSPFPAPGEDQHQPGVPETHFPPQTGE